MEIIEGAILLICLVLLSNILDHFIPMIPVSLIQVVLGLLAALFFHTDIQLNTDWFLLLFVAPLLFNDGRRFPKKELWELRGPIMANAIWLVFLTTVAGGFIFHWLIPTMPLSVTIALAAILSPTDPMAVQSISQRVKLPNNVMHLVSGESLINDASGLIAFKYAIAATVTGFFSLQAATLDFGYISIMGFIMGAVIMIAILLLEEWLYQEGINDVIFITVLQITTPFVIYLLTEILTHASGVIAVVTAGIISHIYNGGIKNEPELTLVRERTWDIIIYTLNGVVFLILGVELPLATTNLIKNDQINTFGAIFLSFIVWLVILLIRVAWIFIYQLWNHFTKKNFKGQQTVRDSFRTALLAGLSGVRGAVTMAGVLSVPIVLNSGADFPSRSLMLFIAAGVIIISLVAATITLPLVSAGTTGFLTRASAADDEANHPNADPAETANLISEDEARIYIMQLAVQRIEEERRDYNSREVFDLILDYQFLIRNLQLQMKDKETMNRVLSDEVALRRVALAGEHQALEQLWHDKRISEKAFQIATKQLNHQENKLMDSYVQRRNHRRSDLFYWFRQLRKWLLIRFYRKKRSDAELTELALAQREQAKGAIKSLAKYLAREDIDNHRFESQSVYHLIVRYRNQIERADDNPRQQAENVQSEELYQALRVRALSAEREGVQILLEQGRINWSMATKLRQYINYSETVLIMSSSEDSSE